MHSTDQTNNTTSKIIGFEPNINEFKDIDENRYEILSYPFMLISVKEWWFIFPIK